MSSSLRPRGLYVAHQPPLSMGFPGQEYWNGLPFPPPGNLPDPGVKPTASPALAGGLFTTEAHLCKKQYGILWNKIFNDKLIPKKHKINNSSK